MFSIFNKLLTAKAEPLSREGQEFYDYHKTFIDNGGMVPVLIGSLPEGGVESFRALECLYKQGHAKKRIVKFSRDRRFIVYESVNFKPENIEEKSNVRPIKASGCALT